MQNDFNKVVLYLFNQTHYCGIAEMKYELDRTINFNTALAEIEELNLAHIKPRKKSKTYLLKEETREKIRNIPPVYNGNYFKYFVELKKQEDKTLLPPHLNIGGDVIGSVIGGGQLSLKDLEIPLKQQTTNIIPTKPNKRSILEIVAWIIGIITGFLLIYEFILKHFFHVNFLW